VFIELEKEDLEITRIKTDARMFSKRLLMEVIEKRYLPLVFYG
jgi:hypothetical protein